MKYKLTQSAIEELKAMEFSKPRYMFVMEGMRDSRILPGEWFFEEIKPKIPKRAKLPKPSIKTFEDFKALKGWEHQWLHNPPSVWFEPKRSLATLEEVSKAKIRQIDMAENEYLVKDCIEQEIEVGDLVEWLEWTEDRKEIDRYGIATDIKGKCLEWSAQGVNGLLEDHKLIRKASEITQSDREKYLGEKQEPLSGPAQVPYTAEQQSMSEIVPTVGLYQAWKDRQLEAKVREIIKKVLKEEAGE